MSDDTLPIISWGACPSLTKGITKQAPQNDRTCRPGRMGTRAAGDPPMQWSEIDAPIFLKLFYFPTNYFETLDSLSNYGMELLDSYVVTFTYFMIHNRPRGDTFHTVPGIRYATAHIPHNIYNTPQDCHDRYDILRKGPDHPRQIFPTNFCRPFLGRSIFFNTRPDRWETCDIRGFTVQHICLSNFLRNIHANVCRPLLGRSIFFNTRPDQWAQTCDICGFTVSDPLANDRLVPVLRMTINMAQLSEIRKCETTYLGNLESTRKCSMTALGLPPRFLFTVYFSMLFMVICMRPSTTT